MPLVQSISLQRVYKVNETFDFSQISRTPTRECNLKAVTLYVDFSYLHVTPPQTPADKTEDSAHGAPLGPPRETNHFVVWCC